MPPTTTSKTVSTVGGKALRVDVEGPPYFIGGVKSFPKLESYLDPGSKVKDNDLASVVQYSSMCRNVFPLVSAGAKNLLDCAKAVQVAAKAGDSCCKPL